MSSTDQPELVLSDDVPTIGYGGDDLPLGDSASRAGSSGGESTHSSG